ncbi:MAG: HEPN domain-containing protein [Saprospiraceae bacterium]|nr:HEPN domain-containing protein [Saprospiraceae bacterium]
MQEMKVATLKSKAEEYLQAAQNEMFKASEDVVPYVICKNAHLSIIQFLKGFLINKGETVKDGASIDDLVEKCKLYNNKFATLQDQHLKCGHGTSANTYCTTVDTVSACIEAALEAKKLTTDSHWPESKRVK